MLLFDSLEESPCFLACLMPTLGPCCLPTSEPLPLRLPPQDTDGHMDDLSASGGYGPGASPDSEELVAQMDLTATFDELISSLDESDQAVLDQVFGLGLGMALDVGVDDEGAAAGGQPAAAGGPGAGKEQGGKGGSKGKAVAVKVEGGKAKVVNGGKSGGKKDGAGEAQEEAEAEQGEEQGEAKTKRAKVRGLAGGVVRVQCREPCKASGRGCKGVVGALPGAERGGAGRRHAWRLWHVA